MKQMYKYWSGKDHKWNEIDNPSDLMGKKCLKCGKDLKISETKIECEKCNVYVDILKFEKQTREDLKVVFIDSNSEIGRYLYGLSQRISREDWNMIKEEMEKYRDEDRQQEAGECPQLLSLNDGGSSLKAQHNIICVCKQ